MSCQPLHFSQAYKHVPLSEILAKSEEAVCELLQVAVSQRKACSTLAFCTNERGVTGPEHIPVNEQAAPP